MRKKIERSFELPDIHSHKNLNNSPSRDKLSEDANHSVKFPPKRGHERHSSLTVQPH